MSARTILKHVYENGGMTEYQYERIDRVLKERERPHGEWIDLSDGWQEGTYECSNCKAEFVLTEGTPEDNEYNFCPNCGSDNRPRILDEAIDGEGKDGNVKEGEAE